MGLPVFWRSAAPLWGWCGERRSDDGFGADVFGHELGVLSEAVAGALDLYHDGMVEQSVEQRGGDDGIAEHLAPFGKSRGWR